MKKINWNKHIYTGTKGWPQLPNKDEFKSLKQSPDREKMESDLKEMINLVKNSGGAFSEPIEALDEFNLEKFKQNISRLQSVITLLIEFQDSYYEYIKDARVAFKLSAPTNDLKNIEGVDKEDINFMIVDTKAHLDDLLDLESEKSELLKNLKYEISTIIWHFYSEDIPF